MVYIPHSYLQQQLDGVLQLDRAGASELALKQLSTIIDDLRVCKRYSELDDTLAYLCEKTASSLPQVAALRFMSRVKDEVTLYHPTIGFLRRLLHDEGKDSSSLLCDLT